MKRNVNLPIIYEWLDRNGGIAELAVKSGVSPHTIMRIKSKVRPKAPGRAITQRLLARAMGVKVDDLFPIAEEQTA